MRSRSTSSWILVRVCAGTPPPSATNSSTLRPASVSLRSFRYCTSARSMSMPPEASGPVFTVMRPSRIAFPWEKRFFENGNAVATPAACTNLLLLNVMGPPPRSRCSVGRRAGLLERMCFHEGVDLHAFLVDAHHGRHAGHIALEIAGGADHLAGHADVGEGDRIAVEKPASLLLVLQMALDGLEAFQRPV